MSLPHWDVVVIGGGPAGMAAASEARAEGAERVLVIERNTEAGGILPQCVHNGFGLRVFGSDLTGPEYASRWLRRAEMAQVEFMLQSMVLEINADRRVLVSGAGKLHELSAGALVLATGCRERPRGALNIAGSRPAGILTAGTAQRLVNIEGYMPGKRYVILGSGDIGMIMARRLTLAGAQVLAMAEVLPYVSGLRRNLVQCVHDFDIPLHTSTTVTRTIGRERLEAVELCAVDQHWQPLCETARTIACDTLLLSVGLLPEIELARMAHVGLDPLTGGARVDESLQTSVPGVFAAGNMVHVYDLVDAVTESALRAGRQAARYVLGNRLTTAVTPQTIELGVNIHHVVPQVLHLTPELDELVIELRVRSPIEQPVRVEFLADGERVVSQRLRYARPSEMIVLTLKPDEIACLQRAEHLSVNCRPWES
ncbi:MAG: FAD-dependent oxidoreductase [Chloroflexi bacterium]|nr:FAD-dependent oxidoreductase [Chloroflexota bacterium]